MSEYNPSDSDFPSASDDSQEELLDTIADDDETVPPEFRGCRVVACKTDTGTKVFYKGSGFTLPEDRANILIQAFRIEKETIAAEPAPREKKDTGRVSAWETPAPGDMVLRSLGYDNNVPEKLQGSRLIKRGETKFYLTLDGEAVPEEVGAALLEAMALEEESSMTDSLEHGAETDTVVDSDLAPLKPVDDPPSNLEASVAGSVFPIEEDEDEEEPTVNVRPSSLKAQLKNTPSREVSGDKDTALGPKETGIKPQPGEMPIESLGQTADIPQSLRGSLLVQRDDGFYFRTPTGELIPKDVGEDLMDAWEEEIRERSLSSPPEPEQHVESESQQPEPQQSVSEQPEPEQPEPEQLEPEQPEPEQPVESESQQLEPEQPVESESQQLESNQQDGMTTLPPEILRERLEDVQRLAELLRRDLAVGVINLSEIAPDSSVMEEALYRAVNSDTGNKHLDRFTARSLDILSHLETTWAGEQDRAVKAWHNDIDNGTLVLATLNPLQAKDIDLLALVTLVRLRAKPEENRKTVHRIVENLRKSAIKNIKDVFKPTSVVEEIVSTAQTALSKGMILEDVLVDWMAKRVYECLEQASIETIEKEGFSIPNLPAALAESFEPLCEALSHQLMD